MTTSAKIIADSINNGSRLTTMEVTLHRFVLAEFNTHRAFSRNSASSRAIPVEKQLERINTNPAWPIEWPCEQPGMQGGTELSKEDRGDDWSDYLDANLLFQNVKDATVGLIKSYLEMHPDKSTRLHKSLINRLLEPFMWHTIVVTSTEWENFFQQRCSPLAQPEIRVAAELMQEVLKASTPVDNYSNRWGSNSLHLPYISKAERETFALSVQIAASVARCARVSTLQHDSDTVDIYKDMELFLRLLKADPPHWSPFEHVGIPTEFSSIESNFKNSNWSQLRHDNMSIEYVKSSVERILSERI